MRKSKAETIAYAIKKECQRYSLYDWCDSWDITTDEFDEFLALAVDNAEVGEQSETDSPHYYAIWSYEDEEWQIYVPNNFTDKEIILLAWTELPEPYYKECEENKVIDTDNAVERLKEASYERFGNDGMGGELVVNLDDAIEIIKGGGKE